MKQWECLVRLDGTAGVPVEPVSEGATLENDSSWIPCEWPEWPEWPDTAVDSFISSSASSAMLPHSGGWMIMASVPVKSIGGTSVTSFLKLSMSAGLEVTSTMQVHRVLLNWSTLVSNLVG